PGGQAYLQLDQIEPGNGLGHRVFDLDARVGFHEYEVAAVLVDQKLDGAQAAIADRCGEGAGGVQQPPAQVGIQSRCRRHFDDLLMTALQAAFPLPQVADLLAVTGDLHFDMPGPGNQPLDIELAIAEGGPGFGAAALECVRQLGEVGDQPHAPAATPGQRLEQHRGALRQCLDEGLPLPQCSGLRGTLDHGPALALGALSPNSSSTRASGPMKVMPASAQARASSALSLRKPYPGRMASQPCSRASQTIWSISR